MDYKKLISEFLEVAIKDISEKKGDVATINELGGVLVNSFENPADKNKVGKLVEIITSVVDGDSATFLDIDDMQFLGDTLLKSLSLDDDFDKLIDHVHDTANGVLNVINKHFDATSPVHLQAHEIKDFFSGIFHKVIELPADERDSTQEIVIAIARSTLESINSIIPDDFSNLVLVAKKGLLEISAFVKDFAEDAITALNSIYTSLSGEEDIENASIAAGHNDELGNVLDEVNELQQPPVDEVKDEL